MSTDKDLRPVLRSSKFVCTQKRIGLSEESPIPSNRLTPMCEATPCHRRKVPMLCLGRTLSGSRRVVNNFVAIVTGIFEQCGGCAASACGGRVGWLAHVWRFWRKGPGVATQAHPVGEKQEKSSCRACARPCKSLHTGKTQENLIMSITWMYGHKYGKKAIYWHFQ